MLRACQLDGVAAPGCRDDIEARRLQHLSQPVAVGALVVDHQHPRLGRTTQAYEVEPSQAAHQLLRGHRLDEVVDRTQRDPELGIVDDADHDHGDRPRDLVVFEAVEHLPAVESGQQYVEGDGGGLRLPRPGHHIDPAAQDLGAKARLLELSGKQLPGWRVVFHDEDQRPGRVAVRMHGCGLQRLDDPTLSHDL